MRHPKLRHIETQHVCGVSSVHARDRSELSSGIIYNIIRRLIATARAQQKTSNLTVLNGIVPRKVALPRHVIEHSQHYYSYFTLEWFHFSRDLQPSTSTAPDASQPPTAVQPEASVLIHYTPRI